MNKWDKRFIELAFTVAKWSKDPERQVGCVLVEPEKREFSFGYNGFPTAITDSDERLADTEVKNSMTVHAELNAILNRQGSVREWYAYVTATPCVDCCKAIIQAGIAEVHCPAPGKNSKWYESQLFGLNLLHESDVKIVHFEDIFSSKYEEQGQINNATTDKTIDFYCHCQAPAITSIGTVSCERCGGKL